MLLIGSGLWWRTRFSEKKKQRQSIFTHPSKNLSWPPRNVPEVCVSNHSGSCLVPKKCCRFLFPYNFWNVTALLDCNFFSLPGSSYHVHEESTAAGTLTWVWITIYPWITNLLSLNCCLYSSIQEAADSETFAPDLKTPWHTLLTLIIHTMLAR